MTEQETAEGREKYVDLVFEGGEGRDIAPVDTSSVLGERGQGPMAGCRVWRSPDAGTTARNPSPASPDQAAQIAAKAAIGARPARDAGVT